VLVADVALRSQLLVGGLACLLVLEQADLPEFLAHELVELVAQQSAHERVGVEDHPGAGVQDEDAVPGSLEQPPIPELGILQGGTRSPAFGDVLDAHEDQPGLVVVRDEPMGVEQHAPPPDRREVVFDLEILEGTVLGYDVLQQRSQQGAIPLAVAQVVEEPLLRLVLRDVEGPIEGGVRRIDLQAIAEDDQRLSQVGDNVLGIVECILHGPLVPSAFGNVPEDQHGPDDVAPFVADRAAGTVVDGMSVPSLAMSTVWSARPTTIPSRKGAHGGPLDR